LFIQRLFTTIAPRYDWFNRLASLGLDQRWRKQAVAASGLRESMAVLDVCTGTGDIAGFCTRRTHGDGLVVGLDFNGPMLEGASRKQRAGRWPVSWIQADAQALPFRAGSFDRVFIGFSTRNLSDLQQGVREMLRVLKTNGQLVILETGRPSNPLVRMGYRLFLATVARAIGWLLTGTAWPFTYLARSVKQFLTPMEFVALLTACGSRARYVPLSSGLASRYLATKTTEPSVGVGP